jgi:uncharacterized membrane protein required for colicin V production
MLSIADIVIIAGAVAAGAWGAWRGFIAQLGSLVAILAAIAGCQLWGDNVSALLGVNTFISWVVLFVVLYVAVRIIATFVRGAARTLHMGAVDRTFGGLFYMFKWLIVASIFINIWLVFKPDTSVSQGKISPTVTRLAPRLLGHVTQYVNTKTLPNN